MKRHKGLDFEEVTCQRGARLCVVCLAYQRDGDWAGHTTFVGADRVPLDLDSRAKIPPCPGPSKETNT